MFTFIDRRPFPPPEEKFKHILIEMRSKSNDQGEITSLRIILISTLFRDFLKPSHNWFGCTFHVYLPLNGSGGLNFDNGLNVHLQAHLEALLVQQEAYELQEKKSTEAKAGE